MNAKLMRNIKDSLVTILSVVIALVWIAPLFWLELLLQNPVLR